MSRPEPAVGFSVNTDGCEADDLAFCGGVLVTAGAAEPWDSLVDLAVSNEWVGLEALSGLPGSVGEATACNFAAYGQQVAESVARVRTWDIEEDRQRTFPAVDCGFREGGSRFTGERRADGSERYAVLDVAFLLRQGDLTTPLADNTMLAALGAAPGDRVPIATVRATVLGTRSGRP